MKTTRVKRGNKTCEYLTLVEAVREGGKVGHRVLFRLGEVEVLRRTGELERIVAALQYHCDVELVAARERWRRCGLYRAPDRAQALEASARPDATWVAVRGQIRRL